MANQGLDPGYNPAAEAFKNFDQDQPNSHLGSLHIDTEDEPRRGASRANSVRFDESALHSHFGHTSRSSTDYLPLRTGSGIGSHPMTERTSSHKSDGKQSSAGHSTHSARASSFVLESRPLSATVAPFVPLGPPLGLFILGPVPAIIRCWLDTKFSNDSLLYAAICTGSYKSALDVQLVNRLGIDGQVTENQRGERVVKIPVYLPEATIQQPASRNSSPASRLPTLTVEFMVQSLSTQANAIQVFLGCDILRTQSADILFSLDRITLFDDERNKVAVPLVRPENALAFQNLQTSHTGGDASNDTAGPMPPAVGQYSDITGSQPVEQNLAAGSKTADQGAEELEPQPSSTSDSAPLIFLPSVIGEARKPSRDVETAEKAAAPESPDNSDAGAVINGNALEATTKSEGANIWGSWRRDSLQNGRADTTSSTSTISGYQRATRGRGMKVLKPARLNTSRSTSINQGASGFEGGNAVRSVDNAKASQATVTEILQSTPSSATDKSLSNDTRAPLQSLSNRPRSANPVGGASAFPWLNTNENKPPSSTGE